LSGIVERGIGEEAPTVMNFDDIAITTQFAIATFFDIFGPRIFGKAPFATLENFLPAGKFEFPASDGFDDMDFRGIFAADGNENLSNPDPGGDPDRFPVRTPHPTRQPIGAGTTQHLIGPEDHIGMRADPDMIRILSNHFRQMFVNRDPAGLEGLGGNLLFFITDEVADVRKEIDRRTFMADIKNPNLGFRNAATIPRFNIRFILLVPITPCRTTTHDGGERNLFGGLIDLL